VKGRRLKIAEYSRNEIEIVLDSDHLIHVAFCNNDSHGREMAQWIIDCCNKNVMNLTIIEQECTCSIGRHLCGKEN